MFSLVSRKYLLHRQIDTVAHVNFLFPKHGFTGLWLPASRRLAGFRANDFTSTLGLLGSFHIFPRLNNVT
jgi:hypothetical protein